MALFYNMITKEKEKHSITTVEDHLAPVYLVFSKTEIVDRRAELPTCAQKYVDVSGDFPVEMSGQDKAIVDQEEADALALAEENAKDIDNLSQAIKVLAKLTFKEINKLRVKNGDTEYTWEQFKTAFKSEWS